MYNLGIFTPGALKEATILFENKGYIAIDSILEQPYIEDLYNTAPNIDYDYRGGTNDSYETIPWNEKERGEELGQKLSKEALDADFSYFDRISGV